MSNVNGNNIDDLFKRASDHYPLRTDGSDWNRMAAALDKDTSHTDPSSYAEDRQRKRRWFWLFFLLPLGGVAYYALQGTTHTRQEAIVQKATGAIPAQAAGEAKNKAEITKATEEVTGNGGGTKARENTGANKDGSVKANLVAGTGAGIGTDAGRTGSGYIKVARGTYPASDAGTNAGAATGATAHRGGKGRTGTGNLDEERTVATGTPSGRRGKGLVSSVQQGEPVNAAGTGMGMASEKDMKGSEILTKRASTADKPSLNVLVRNDHPGAQVKDSATAKPQKKNSRNSYFYAGLIVAPDLSLVKFQSVKGVGTTAGILLGYNFNHRWALETGLYLDKKKYYTDGRYFKLKNNITLPAGSKLLTVDGSCDMLEIPINVRYNLSQGPKMSWFAAAGFSTYLMSKEEYNYEYEYTPGGTPWYKPWSNKKPSQFWFSVLNLSIGFEQRLGKIGDLRLEPYVRAPLSGIGTGSLPIMSAGLNIGITHKFR